MVRSAAVDDEPLAWKIATLRGQLELGLVAAMGVPL
jgi:hypothetical protein